MSTEIKEALRLSAMGYLQDYKNRHQAKQRALTRGDLEDLIEMEDLEQASWEQLLLAIGAYMSEPVDQTEESESNV